MGLRRQLAIRYRESLGGPLTLRLQCPALQNEATVSDCWFAAEIFDTLVWADLRSDRIIASWKSCKNHSL